MDILTRFVSSDIKISSKSHIFKINENVFEKCCMYTSILLYKPTYL